MVKRFFKKFSLKYSFLNHLESELGFIKKHELKNVIVYDREDYEMVVCIPNGLEGNEYVVLSCNNEHIFEINFIPKSEMFTDILVKTSIREYEKRIEEDSSKTWTPSNRV